MKRLLFALALCCLPTLAFAEDITIQNLVRAESDTMFRMGMKENNISIGKISHIRQVTSANAPQPL